MAMPEEVQDTFGYALHLAQVGQKHPDTKSLKGFGSAGVLEVVEDFQGDAYRAVYTVRYAKDTLIYSPTAGLKPPDLRTSAH